MRVFVKYLVQARRKRGGGAGGLHPPNNLLKFVDFVSEKAVKAKVVRIKIQTRIYNIEEIDPKCNTFDVMQVEISKFSWKDRGKTILLCFRQWHSFQKWGVFQRSKERGHEKFPLEPPFLLASLAPRSSPPPISISFRQAC